MRAQVSANSVYEVTCAIKLIVQVARLGKSFILKCFKCYPGHHCHWPVTKFPRELLSLLEIVSFVMSHRVATTMPSCGTFQVWLVWLRTWIWSFISVDVWGVVCQDAAVDNLPVNPVEVSCWESTGAYDLGCLQVIRMLSLSLENVFVSFILVFIMTDDTYL